jgi:ClpP class serine protease
MADGRVFLGRQAIEAGLVDGVSTLTALVAQLNQERRGWRPGAGAALNPPTPNPSMKETPMDLKELREQHPELAQALLEEGRAEGRAQELDRVKGCLGAAILGYEEQAKALALDGKTTPGEAALAINSAHNADLKAAQAKAEKGGPEPLPNAGDSEALEAEEARKKAEAEKNKNAEPSAQDWTDRINAHIAKAEGEGRKLSAAQAAAELRKQDEEK